MTLEVVVETLIKAVIVIGALLTGFAYLTLFERKVQARMQQRPGPNRVGPWGLLQPAADGLKLFFKSSSAPSSRDRFLYLLAPMISIMAALASFAIIPISGPGPLNFFGHPVGWYVMNVNIGVLWYFAVTSVGVYGIFLAGYASNSKYSMLGALRSSAQMISYEMALGLSLVPVFILAGSARLVDIVNAQHTWWFILPLLPAFFLYLIAGIAETNRAPFDLPEAETELVAGYHTEYSGLRFALFFMAEYINMIIVSSVATIVFLGGWWGPLGILPGPWWFVLKVVALLYVYVWLRATLPRMRYDRLMALSWKSLFPLSLAMMMITAIVVVAAQGTL
jgi:NADH-quinone oxidoreductase subunit H